MSAGVLLFALGTANNDGRRFLPTGLSWRSCGDHFYAMGMERKYETYHSLPEPLRTMVSNARKGEVTIFLEDGDGVAILQKFNETLHEFNFDVGAKELPAWSNAEWSRINKDFDDSFVEVQA